MECDIFKNFGHFQQSTEMRFKFVKSNRSMFPMVKMCQTLQNSMSEYYAWCNRPESHQQWVNTLLRKRILAIYNEHNGMIGRPMLISELRIVFYSKVLAVLALTGTCEHWDDAISMQRNLFLQHILHIRSLLLLI